VPKKTILALALFAVLSLAGGFAWDAGLFAGPPPPLVETPEAVAAGRQVFTYRCTGCHRDVRLDARLKGWTADRAYQTVGRLETVPKANMPPFPGSEEERRAVAIFLAAVGAGRARTP
jgi:mono/diheme cytochrome c family protein